jgi:hypothetical protein
MQNECVRSEATPLQPQYGVAACAEQELYMELCASRCECDVPRSPPCVPQPGIPARSRRSAPRQLDERWKFTHFFRAFLRMNRTIAVQRLAYPAAHPKQLKYASTSSRGRGVIAPFPCLSPVREDFSVWEDGLDSQERHVAGENMQGIKEHV